MTAKDALIALIASVVILVSHVMNASLLSMLLVRENPKEKMLISVTKLTNVDQFRKANAFTTGRSSKMTLADASTGKKIELKPKE